MFWRFGFHNPSAVDTLLEREDVTLEEILEEEELLQEAKSHNQKLINFLCQPAICEKLLYYITANDLEDGQKKFKFPFLSSELIACEIPQLVELIVLEQRDLLDTFWLFLDRPVPAKDDPSVDYGLETLLSSYFAKTITVFLTKQPAEMVEFIESKPENLTKILNHLHNSAIMDLLLTLVRMEELPEGKGIVQWLSDGGLLSNLVDRLDPNLDTEEHSIAQQCICEIIRMSQTSLLEQPSIGINDLITNLKSEPIVRKLAGFMLDAKAPNATSTLINGVAIIIDLIRHNNSDMENDPMLNSAYGYANNSMMRQTPVSLAELLKVLADHVVDFNNLLTHPRSVTGPTKTSIGEQMPLGFERLKICELFAELLHCSNMSNLNASDDESRTPEDKMDENDEATQTPAAKPDETKTEPPTSPAELPMGDYLKLQLVENKVLPTCIDLFFSFPWNNFLHYVTYDMLHQVFNGPMDKEYNRLLALSILKDGQLTTKMVQAQKDNDTEWSKPKGMRLGYMGHLTFIADEVIKLFEGYPEAIVQDIRENVDLDLWQQYCETELRETKERDCLPLGGDRPADGDAVMHDDDDEEDELEAASANPYSRYLAQRDMDGGLDDDEDDAHWITGRNDNIFSNSFNNALDDERHNVNGMDDEAEYDSDEEQMDRTIAQDWSRSFTEFPPANVLRRTQSHIEDGYDEEEPIDGQDASPVKDEEDPFGDFASSDTHGFQDDDEAWGMSNSIEQLNLSKDGATDAFGATSDFTDQHFVPAIRTKEEDNKYNKEFLTHHEDEQEGEI
ncbi:SAPS-domain-containing protein [Hesseltinella vesiculosa]|uniref:SAPS-domain-containing protein n=1 Tax=Hesseltinella vesiculosa TaxID=101127 RepID=A0A1X2GF83_9FUNG|nr:SAPS-domain-containing protein [Hesseltinella vesiculosa]